MDAVFSWRRTRACDLPACLALHPAKNGAETVGSAQAMKVWRELFGMTHATRTAVAEMHGKGESKIVGFGFAAFVKKSFAEAEVRNPRPGLNSRIIESVVAGKPVIATFEDVRDANTQGDLQQVILDTSWHNALLSPTQRDEVRVLLGIAYMDLHVGYHFSRILSEMVDELDLWHVRDHRSFQIADRFEAYRLSNPNTTWNADRALLWQHSTLCAPILIPSRLDCFSIISNPGLRSLPGNNSCWRRHSKVPTMRQQRVPCSSACLRSSVAGKVSSSALPR